MIPKRINRAPENDNYRALALYVADAVLGKDREKLFSVGTPAASPTRMTTGQAWKMWSWFRP